VRRLHVVLSCAPEELQGDAASNYAAFLAVGGTVQTTIEADCFHATLVVDALLGAGLNGAPRGQAAEWITLINHRFPQAKVVAVDVPSGMNSDSEHVAWEHARADLCVTFTAPRVCHVMAPACHRVGRLVVGRIGTREKLLDDVALRLSEAEDFRPLFQPRSSGAHKGDFGHVLLAGGQGAIAMAGLAALRVGSGLATVACDEPGYLHEMPELMRIPAAGFAAALKGKRVLALGPALGAQPALLDAALDAEQPLVLDADALTALSPWRLARASQLRVLTPHPGEMSRLTGLPVSEIQRSRLAVAQHFAREHGVVLVLKGERTLIALPDGRVWINPTGSPAMGKGGSGDVLCGMIAGLLAQFPERGELAVASAVWLHGRCGELGAVQWGEQSLLATDLLSYLPQATGELRGR
jgi:ADP-dependent NAD(P)H-hydrate dehydratase / NAD(P)H-hydrate epimerase